ncbi:uncharacterized protein LOC127129757, partial [Lathyrus oleraceus]|uniref:uncharacterized protein LOC127129757 n=1 Tax=Pisum sativum TaxID=3888 RepID=UPI0021D365EA
MSMEFGDIVTKFDIFDAMKHPMEEHSIFHIELISELVDDASSELFALDFPSLSGFDDIYSCFDCTDTNVCVVYAEIDVALQADTFPTGEVVTNKPVFAVDALDIPAAPSIPSTEQPPSLEIKELPKNLKYAYLESNEKLPVIISSNLDFDQEHKLLQVLKKHKKAIGWTLADLPGISRSMCMHRILLEDGSKTVRQPQRRLNPLMLDVVKKEVTKLLQAEEQALDECLRELDSLEELNPWEVEEEVLKKEKEVVKLLYAGMIYPISDSPWVSPVHVVPKKGGITVIRNDKDELIPTKVATGWRMCIGYRRLNTATRKDHFPLPFMDQMLERLFGQQYYCFLDGYSGYNQIAVDPADHEKTAFTCPFGIFAYRKMPFGLCNAPATFQRCVQAIFADLIEKTVEVFMDDFSVFGGSFSLCLDNLETVLERCVKTNLVLNWEKCHFMVTEGIVLGHKVSSRGIEVDRAKVEVIEKLPPPANMKGVRSFLGHAGFYRRF